ncbi:hypothetical protein AGMMS49965_20160 [Bacteroidia bacterium]|nr:hypothetical protein AGMMS49965_20160 [Bacteroidia bacterium]
MKRAGNLIEQIQDLDNLYLAYFKAKRGKSATSAVIDYERHLDENIKTLQRQLQTGEVEIGNYHYFTILDPKERLICAANFPQRVLHHAIMNVCHPYFEQHLIDDTYATRIDKGIYKALDKARLALKHYRYAGKLDFRKYFDSVSHAVLKAQLRRLFKDPHLLALFDKIIDSYETTPGCGIPIGNLTSQYFANYYLSAMDHYAKEVLQIPVYIRYMDDILIFENDKTKLKEDIAKLDELALNNLHLHFKPVVMTKSEQGISFLGYKLYPHKVLLNSRSKKRYKEKLNRYNHLLDNGLWDERTYQQHIIPLVAFARWAYAERGLPITTSMSQRNALPFAELSCP